MEGPQKKRKTGHAPPPVRTIDIEPVDVAQGQGLDADFSILLGIIAGIRHSFPVLRENGKDRPIRPIILKTQLLALHGHASATQLEHELEDLRREGKVHVFRLSSGVGDASVAVMLPEDYLANVRDLELSAATDRERPFLQPEVISAVLGEASTSPNQELSEGRVKALLREKRAAANDEEADRGISALLRHCILQREGAGRLSVMIPGSGTFQKHLREGRKEVLSFLSKRKYSEVLESELRKKKLKGSSLGVEFHVQDLLGSGQLLKKQSTAGTILRCTNAKR